MMKKIMKNKSGYKHYNTENSNNILKPENFYSVCVDDFFINPNTIRNFGLNLSKKPDITGTWPGLKSESLHNIDIHLNTVILLKVLSVYFDLKYENIEWEESDVCFQQIKKFSKNKNSILNKGWIHQDNKNSLAGIIYLSPNINPEAGTSLYNLKENEKENFIPYTKQNYRHMLYTGDKIDEYEYEKSWKKHNEKFIEKTRFQNIFNRMICYDSNEFHSANNYFSDNEDRLTLIFFINKIKVKKNPITRVKDAESFDEVIENKIKNLSTLK